MGYKLVEWVGNSYMFNAAGLLRLPMAVWRATRHSVRLPSRTTLFCDNILAFPTDPKGWHRPRPSGQCYPRGWPHRILHGDKCDKSGLVGAPKAVLWFLCLVITHIFDGLG